MTRIDKIILLRDEKSTKTLQEMQYSLENYLRCVASATERAVVMDGTKITAVITKPVSLFSVNKILNHFSKEGFEVEEFSWNRNYSGEEWKGCFKVTLS